MKSKEFEQLSKETQTQYFRLWIEFIRLMQKEKAKRETVEK